jgi:hypothetical protein
MDGVPGSQVNDELIAIAARREELARQLERATLAPPLLHPRMPTCIGRRSPTWPKRWSNQTAVRRQRRRCGGSQRTLLCVVERGGVRGATTLKVIVPRSQQW